MVTISAIVAIVGMVGVCGELVAAEYCTPAVSSGWGDNKHVQLEDVKLSPGVKSWGIEIPASAACYPGYPVGASVIVCDSEPPRPVVHLSSAHSGKVTRLSNLWGYASVHTTVFCHESVPLISTAGLGSPGLGSPGLGAAPGGHAALAPTLTPQ